MIMHILFIQFKVCDVLCSLLIAHMYGTYIQ